MMRGFITFEGGEGAGKSSVMNWVKEQLLKRGYDPITTREPGGSLLGEQIRNWLLNANHSFTLSKKAELLLFLSARAQLIEEVILPNLEKGKIILCDRFNDSTIAYQGSGRGLGREYVKGLCDTVSGQVRPQLTLLLDISAKEGLLRAKRAQKEWEQDRFENETLLFHEKIRTAFLSLAKEDPSRVHILDATQPFESVAQKALHLILEVLSTHAI